MPLVSDDIRRLNRADVLSQLFRDGALSRTTLATKTGLTRAAISRIADELIACGLIRESEHSVGRPARGRPQVGLELRAAGGYVVGVGLGAFEQALQVTNLRGECLARRRLRLKFGTTAAAALKDVALSARALMKEVGAGQSRLLGVTLAVAGVVDHIGGVVIESPNLGWSDVDAGSALSKALAAPVQVEAMHHVLNQAEAARPAVPHVSDTVLVNVAMGIGASVMEQGHIVRGHHAAAGQIGHMRTADNGELCTCGRFGCLDTVASGFAVLRRLGRVEPRRIAREHRTADANRLLVAIAEERAGDAKVRSAFRHCGTWLGAALDGVRAVVDPERILLAGPLCEVPSFVEGVRTRFYGPADAAGRGAQVPLALSTQSTDAAAAIMALAQFAFSPRLDLARLRR